MTEEPIRVLLFSGSRNVPAHTRANVCLAAELLQRQGASCSLWDAYTDPLPMHDPVYHRNPHDNQSQEVRRLARLAEDADAFVWATPVYHNSFSGVLKNALDNLSYRYFRNKPVALVSHGDPRCGVQPCDQLRIVARGLLAVAIPTQVVTVNDDFQPEDNQYRLVDKVVQERFRRMVNELLAYARLMRRLRQTDTP